MKLTIMVTTIPSRNEKLFNLVDKLGMALAERFYFSDEKGTFIRWRDHGKGVEILSYSTAPYDEIDPDLTFGGKRNTIIGKATGEYLCCFDDDDEPHPRFLELVLAAIEQKPDVIGYKVACYGYANGCASPEIMEPADVSTKYDGWYNDRNGFKYVRCPHHIVPVRAEHVRAIGFKAMHHGEDHEYSIRLRDSGLLKKEVYIDEYMYVYLFNGKKAKGE
jgi:GT2 family glycosyltransferase